MSFEDYANHISQKLKLAVSMAIIRNVPKNLTTDQYINQLKSNILDQKDSNSEISVCSDDFELDDSNFQNPINNNNTSDNNDSDNNAINNANLSNNSDEGDTITNDFDNNCIGDNEIDNITLINDTKAVTVTRNEENNTTFKINDRENDYIEINEEDNDIFTTDNNITLENDDYNDLIDEVLQLDDSPTILNDFCVNDIENTDNMNKDGDINIEYSKEMSVQDISNATQATDFTQATNFTQTLDFNDETYYESIRDTNTEKATKMNQKLPNSDIKRKKDDRCMIIDDTNTKKSNLNYEISIEHGPNPKRKKNLDPKLQTDRQIEDPNSRIKNNISKFLDKHNIASKSKVITENEKVKDSLDKNFDQNNTECTQTNTYYSQSQPLLVIDQKYIYEKFKSMPTIEKDLNLGTELIKKDLNISTNDTKATINNVENIYHDITDKNSITKDTALVTTLEDPNYKTNTMKIIENDTAFHFEREVYLFSQSSVCNVRNDDKLTEDIITKLKDNRNALNNKMKKTIIANNLNNNKSETITEKYNAKNSNIKTEATKNINNRKEIQSKIDLTQELSPISEQNNKNRNQDNNNNFNNNDTTQTSINSIGVQLSPLYQNKNNETTESNRNNNNNETTQSIDITQNTTNNLPVEDLNQNEEINQSRNSNSDLTDSDEVQTEEVIPFKIVEELNKVKNYLNKIERGTDSSSDTGYKSDSQSRYSMKSSQSNIRLNQSAHSLFTYITRCPLISNTQDITKEISVVLSQLIQKLYEDETYLSFMEEILEKVDLLLHSVLDENCEENEFLKKDETMQRILLLNKSIHIQKYSIEKITNILENIHTNLTTENTLYETENIQKIENSCYIFHILHIILQRYYKNRENLTKKQDSSQKSQFSSQKSQFSSQKSQISSQKSQISSQKSQFSSLNSQEMLKKTDISDIWRKKWNPNFKGDKNEENVEKKCVLTDCSKVLNKLIVSCMDGYSLIAYFALKCFNLMQS